MLIQGSVAVLLSLLYNVSAQTLYTVSAGTIFNPWANATLSVSEIGTGADGGTTYVEVATAVPSVYVTQEMNGITYSTPVTVDVGPFTVTFVEDATGYCVSGVEHGESYAETCTFAPDGRGTCVDSLAVLFESSTTVFTFSGSVHPFYTLTAATVISSTPSPTAPPPNAAVQNSVSLSYGVLFMSFVLGLCFL
ncbi:hypothetical protein C8R45DRAFT_1100947 [Mycena sanguinolenta]|nr:hypothetical protein C8R45DRAFT_1100947 [Mycena sanguinolenta]